MVKSKLRGAHLVKHDDSLATSHAYPYMSVERVHFELIPKQGEANSFSQIVANLDLELFLVDVGRLLFRRIDINQKRFVQINFAAQLFAANELKARLPCPGNGLCVQLHARRLNPLKHRRTSGV